MLLKDYLHSGMQRVKVGDARSDWQEVRRGVPQGSVLGPMFFNIFINDLFLHIKTAQLNMYADDGQLYTANSDPVSLERRISCEVSSANAWYEINGMIANPSKHQGMILIPNRTFLVRFGGLSGEFGRAIVRILARRSRAKILMVRPNELDMLPKRIKKGAIRYLPYPNSS